jgi:hypothetical protein
LESRARALKEPPGAAEEVDMTRIRTGWRLAKDSWAVLRADRSLAIFPLLSFAFAAVAFALLIAPGIGAAAAAGKEWPVVPFALIGSYAATFFSIYFNVALAGAATKSMQGHDTTLRDGLDVARERRGLIARWALVQWAVGLLIQVIQNAADQSPAGRIVAGIISGILGAAWAVATFFIVPVLALEGLGPGDAIKRSVALVRERWGEGLVGNAAIGLAVFLVGVIPVGGLLALGFATLGSAPVVGVAALTLGVLALIALSVVGSALGVIFRVALYRFATTGAAADGFAEADLATAFRPKRRFRR